MPGVLCKYIKTNTCRQKSKTLYVGHKILHSHITLRQKGNWRTIRAAGFHPMVGDNAPDCRQSLLLLVSWDHWCPPAQPHLHSIDNSCHCLLSDIVQPVLVGSDNHPSFQLATCWEHHGVRAQLQIIILLRILCHKLLGSRQRVLRLEPVLPWTQR